MKLTDDEFQSVEESEVKNDKSAAELITRGKFYLCCMRYVEAFEAFKSASMLSCSDDEFSVVFGVLSSFHGMMGDYTKAIEYLEKALKYSSSPSHADNLCRLSLIKFETGDVEGMVSLIEEALEISKSPSTSYHYSDVFAVKKDFNSSIKQLENAIAMDKYFIPAYIKKAHCYINLENISAAISTLNVAQKYCEPSKSQTLPNYDLADVINCLAELEGMQGNIENALKLFDECISKFSLHPKSYLNRGILEITLCNMPHPTLPINPSYEAAEKFIRKSIELDPHSPANFIQLASIQFSAASKKEENADFMHAEALKTLDQALDQCKSMSDLQDIIKIKESSIAQYNAVADEPELGKIIK